MVYLSESHSAPLSVSLPASFELPKILQSKNCCDYFQAVDQPADHLRRGAKVHPAPRDSADRQADPVLDETNGGGGGAVRGKHDFGRVPRTMNQLPQDAGQVPREVGGAAAKFGSRQFKFGRVEGLAGGQDSNGQADAGQGQVQKPQQIAEPHLQHEEENQVLVHGQLYQRYCSLLSVRIRQHGMAKFT